MSSSSSSSSPSSHPLTPIPKPHDVFLSAPSSWSPLSEPLPFFASARLEHYKEEGSERKILRSYSIGKKVVNVLGRMKESSIYYDHQSISRQHAAIIQQTIEGQPCLIIVDLGSHGGTFVNNFRLPPSIPFRLAEDDVIRFGSPLRYFQLKDSSASRPNGSTIEENALSLPPPPSSSPAPKRSPDDSSSDSRQSKRGKPDPKKEIRVKHILVKHANSRKPASWRSTFITRSEEEAEQEILKYKAIVQEDQTKFDELATKYSDCSSHGRLLQNEGWVIFLHSHIFFSFFFHCLSVCRASG